MTTDRTVSVRPAARAASLVRAASPQVETPGFVTTLAALPPAAPAPARSTTGAVAASARVTPAVRTAPQPPTGPRAAVFAAPQQPTA